MFKLQMATLCSTLRRRTLFHGSLKLQQSHPVKELGVQLSRQKSKPDDKNMPAICLLSSTKMFLAIASQRILL